MVLVPSELKVSRSLAKVLRNHEYEVRADTAFREVMEACAAPRRGQHGTWITQEMMDAYVRMHDLGYAHSVETWIDGKLAGGLYGMALGHAFFGESMFSRASNASKIALVHLVRQLRRWDFGIIDCQMNTPLLASFGARELPREDFTNRLKELVNYPANLGHWRIEHGAAE
jgi:leucyl/phenylalanyl-tRNA--protein transferase